METIKYPTETKAAKEHRCNFCGEKIHKNEVYLKSTYVADGGLYDWKTHKRCADLANKLKMYEDCDEGVTQDDFVEIVSNAHDDLLINLFPQEDIKKYSDVIQQIRKVGFRAKLFYVLKNIDKIVK